MLLASTEWSAGPADAAPDPEAWLLPDAFSHAVAEWLPPASHLTTHRRGYNHSSDADDRRMLFDPEVGLAVCGDWPAGWRVEGAFLSGVRVVDAICDSKGFTSGEPRS